MCSPSHETGSLSFEVGDRVKARYESVWKYDSVKIDWDMFLGTISCWNDESYVVLWDGGLAADSVMSAEKIEV